VGKFYVMAAGIGSHLWFLVISLIMSSVIGLFYYLRIISVMFSKIPKDFEETELPDVSGIAAAGLALTLLTLILVWLGIYPSSLIEVIHKMMSSCA